jgi:pimeloyl-ACP methyl ester carboxylesterase
VDWTSPRLRAVDALLRSDRLQVADGRRVGFAVWGDSDPAAPAVIHCHGTPGGRLVSYRTPAGSGVRHVSLDRPGFGLSDPHPGRTVGDHPGDVALVLDHLGIDRFSALGWSSGGPHALALGACLPGRVERVAVIGCPAPDGDPAFDVTAGMPEINRESRRMLKENPEEDRQDVVKAVQAFLVDPETFLGQIDAILDPVDVAAGIATGSRPRMVVQLRDAFQNGAEGWFEDDMVTVRPWGFALENVRAEVWLWHGERDRLVPIAHGRYIAGRLPRCKPSFSPEDGHVSPLTRLPEILDWLVPDDRPHAL